MAKHLQLILSLCVVIWELAGETEKSAYSTDVLRGPEIGHYFGLPTQTPSVATCVFKGGGLEPRQKRRNETLGGKGKPKVGLGLLCG